MLDLILIFSINLLLAIIIRDDVSSKLANKKINFTVDPIL